MKKIKINIGTLKKRPTRDTPRPPFFSNFSQMAKRINDLVHGTFGGLEY